MSVLLIVWLVADTTILSTQAVTILGVRSTFPCPICLILNNKLWDLSEVVYLRRTREGPLQVVYKAGAVATKKAAKQILGTQSIRNVPVGDVAIIGNCSF